MFTYPDIDPVLLSLGPLKFQWYGLMYLLGFVAAFAIARYRCSFNSQSHNGAISPLRADQIEDLIFYGALGVIIGGRLGYVFFYGWDQFVQNPAWLFKIWQGGMAFHGGVLGVIVAMWWYARSIRCSFVDTMDFVMPLVPIGLGLGRLGNFINQELWGRATDFTINGFSVGMVFPRDPLQLVRHPSQLYQFALEGVLLFVIVFWFSARPRPRYATSGVFLLFYGLFRFVVEFVREPDSHLGFVMLSWMTRGQQLSLPMIVVGIILLAVAYRKKHT